MKTLLTFISKMHPHRNLQTNYKELSLYYTLGSA